MLTIEGLRLKFRNKIYIPLTCKQRGKKLVNKDFTIISNNCWGGTVYEAYNLQKQSPTIGLFFMASDYITFLQDLRGYINGQLSFINPQESKWSDSEYAVNDKRFGKYPIGVLSNGRNNIEIFFLHYHNEKEAKEKWERRKKRINWDRLLVKFNDQNGCTEKEVEKFMKLPFENKLFFTCKKWRVSGKGFIFIKQFFRYEYIKASNEPFKKNKYIDMTKILNSL